MSGVTKDRIILRMMGLLTLLFVKQSCSAEDIPSTIESFFTAHCTECHSGGKNAEADLDLEKFSWQLHDPGKMESWVKILDRVNNGEMPPPEDSKLTTEDRAAFTTELNQLLTSHNVRQQTERGRTTVRRMNRFEYERTVQDLLCINSPLAQILPEETPLYGFDTVSDGLRFSALHIGSYLEAADFALNEAIRLTSPPEHINERFIYSQQNGIREILTNSRPVVRDIGNAVVLFHDASYITKLKLHFKESGSYRIRARAWAYQSNRAVVLRLNAGSYQAGTTRVIGFFDMTSEPREVEVIARIDANEYFYPSPDQLMADADGKNVYQVEGDEYKGEGLALEWIEVEGPIEPTWPPPSVAAVFGDTPIIRLQKSRWENGKRVEYELKPDDEVVGLRNQVTRFATRAFRGHATEEDIEQYVKIGLDALDAGATFERSMRISIRAILTSPQFLVLHERPGRLDGHAIASRLSYFLWQTMPDEELLKLAAEGKLNETNELRTQTERLLNNSRSDAFVESFVDQWLDLRRINATSPDAKLYPEYDELLKLSMLAETRSFFRELLDQDLSIRNFIDSKFALLNRRLAEHYGIDGIDGQEIRPVALPTNSLRGGLLTQASILKVTANGTVTSPVTRGAWVLSRLLNQPPAAPPPGVGSIEPDTRGATTVREQLALHRRDKSCASCHAAIDPPGFALESFDVIGGYRERYRSSDKGDRVKETMLGRNIWEYKLGPQVDASGQLKNGELFRDISDFKKLLLNDPRSITRSVVSNLIVYATGQRIELADRPQVEAITQRAVASDMGLRSILHEIVQSDLFQSK